MSSPSRLVLLAAAVALSGCTAGPLYGTTSVDPATGARRSVLTELRGRIAMTPATTRTAQVFRNAMLYKLNGSTPVAGALYELRYTVSGTDQIAAVEAGTGTPSAALYRMTVDYQLLRTADMAPIAKGQRFAVVPYDRTGQLFAASRAVVDARNQAGEAVAERVLGAIAPVLQREAFTDAPAAVAKN
ncbi:hypothetical protein D3218_05410 [Aureimonas flava]|uniref:LPS-assembly lipoprotein n=1 Tax=Aureimonas flava TaxID=2320271 RepID=A0A3A1WPX5_9HYPH|nr:hypothetical protein [Aureimonas flava]RIY02785.1 hypothetical protein D3218_05410 [Aureimonas flava]